VFAAYVSRHGHAFIDRALYLPKAWADDPARMAAAHVPDGTAFATKPSLAVGMIERAIAAGMPFAWVAADSVYGIGHVEMVLRRAGKGYVLGVNSSHHFRSWQRQPLVAGTAEEIAGAIDPSRWQRLSAGDGTKGARLQQLRIPSVTWRAIGGGGVNVVVGHHGSTSSCGGVFDRSG